MGEAGGVASFSSRQRQLAVAFAESFLPAGRFLPAAGAASVERLETLLAGFGNNAVRAYAALLQSLEYSTLLRYRARFSRLPRQQRQAVLECALAGGRGSRMRLLALGFPLKTAHFDDAVIFEQVGCVYDRSGRTQAAKWMQNVCSAEEVCEDEIAGDVVVVGTGAGGAVVAKELAEAGLAVVMLEEGSYHTRADFTGRAADSVGKLYRDAGATFSFGNTVIPIPLGCTVGGTTAINSGTCFRTPPAVLARWRDEFGLSEFTPEHMEPYFDKVERELGVAEADAKYLGGVARVVARGCDTLGWSHHALARNAPECDGQGVCVFGCPTDAKRSTNVSYVPMALQRAAMLVTGVRAERVLVEHGRAAGVAARSLASGKLLRVRARTVVLACGALHTPALLLRQGLLRGNKALGRNLTIHPAVAASALFDEDIRAYQSIPQGYCVDEFAHQGILLEGSTASYEAASALFNLVGDRLVEVVEAYDRVASFGAMVSERCGGGRVRVLPRGRSLVSYWVSEDVRGRLQQAMVRICEIFLAAGAQQIFPAMQREVTFASRSDVVAFGASKASARDFMLTAYHPLGTCRIGADSRSSVIDPYHQAHQLPGLFVCDGSAVPTSPTVNPQITIMAMATRAAERITASHL